MPEEHRSRTADWEPQDECPPCSAVWKVEEVGSHLLLYICQPDGEDVIVRLDSEQVREILARKQETK